MNGAQVNTMTNIVIGAQIRSNIVNGAQIKANTSNVNGAQVKEGKYNNGAWVLVGEKVCQSKFFEWGTSR